MSVRALSGFCKHLSKARFIPVSDSDDFLSLRLVLYVCRLDVRWNELAIDQIFHGDRLLKNSCFNCHVVD